MLRSILALFLRGITPIIVERIYGGFWQFRTRNKEKIISGGMYAKIYRYYQQRFCCSVGIRADIKGKPVLPHDLNGIHISDLCKIEDNVVIFQQVTIGSNTLINHPRYGAPIIGKNVYIGAGAKIIGKIIIGDNCRIGANCVVVKDMPPNTTAVAATTRYITSNHVLENHFIPASKPIRE